MSTLKLAFLSSLVLELLASVAVALVAVSVGLRLLYGHLDLRTALFALVLAPEAYLPLRLGRHQLPRERRGLERGRPGLRGARATRAPSTAPARDVPDPARAVDRCRSTSRSRTRTRPRPALDRSRSRSSPVEVVAITGPSGCGKSTPRRSVLLGFVVPDHGSVRIGGRPISPSSTPRPGVEHLAWVPQRPAPVRRRRSPTTCASAAERHRRRALGRPSRPHPWTPESPRCRATSRRGSVSAARACRRARRNGSPSPARSCATRHCSSCSTNRPRISTHDTEARVDRVAPRAPFRVAPWSSSPTGPRAWRSATGSCHSKPSRPPDDDVRRRAARTDPRPRCGSLVLRLEVSCCRRPSARRASRQRSGCSARRRG